jgi:hypothetical protein
LHKIISFENKIFIVTPPFTQLNAVSAVLIKGFLNTLNVESVQADLGIEVILKLFSKAGLRDLFKTAILDDAVSDNSKQFLLYRKNTSKRLIR